MFRKINNKKLSVVFVALLILVVLIILIDNKKGRRSFTEDIAPVDTATVSRIEISTKNALEGIVLEKTNGIWKVSKEGKSFMANSMKVNDVLNRLSNMKPSGVISDEKDKWAEYNVTDSAGIHVMVYDKKKKKADFIIGRFNYKPNKNNMYGGSYYNQSGSFKTYVRPTKEKKVYTINEFLAMSFSTDFSGYRNNTVVKLNPDDLVKVSLNYPDDSSFVLEKDNNIWKINGIVADSMKVVNYLNLFKNLNSSGFVENKPLGSPQYAIMMEGDNMVRPVSVFAYYSDDNKVIVTSMNEEAYFDGDQSDLFNRIFVSKNSFLKK